MKHVIFDDSKLRIHHWVLPGALLTILVTMTSCAHKSAFDLQMESYIGQSADRLFLDGWGSASHIANRDNGNMVLSYYWDAGRADRYTGQYVPPLWADPENPSLADQNLWCKAVFEIDKDSVIVDTKWKGTYCPPAGVNIKDMSQ